MLSRPLNKPQRNK